MSDPAGARLFHLDASRRIDQALLNRTLNNWYKVIARHGGIPAPGARPALRRELQAAYTAGVAALLARAESTVGVPAGELYWANRGRIPLWAWHRPYHRFPRISTPVPEIIRPDPQTATIRMAVCGVQVTILPDALDPAMTGRAETRSEWRSQAPGFLYQVSGGTPGLVTEVQPMPPMSVTIQTFYGRDCGPDGLAGYGRGTTAEDKAGATVHPWSGSVGFHEGQHGMDCTEYIKARTPPAFGGRAGMTVAQFEAASQRWQREWQAYQTRAGEFTRARTDNVGLTQDEFLRRHASR